MNRFSTKLYETKKINVPIIFDRDGIINYPRNLIKYPDDMFFIEDSLENISLLSKNGAKILFVFNEPNILKNLVSPDDVEKINQLILELLGKNGCTYIHGIYFSTTKFKEDTMSLPNTGMFKKIEKELKIKLKGGFVVSDDIEHLKAALKFEMKPVLILSGNGNKTLDKLNTFANKKLKNVTKVFNNLKEFNNYVMNQ